MQNKTCLWMVKVHGNNNSEKEDLGSYETGSVEIHNPGNRETFH